MTKAHKGRRKKWRRAVGSETQKVTQGAAERGDPTAGASQGAPMTPASESRGAHQVSAGPRRSREVRSAVPQRPGLLIVEGDSDTLAVQGHSAFADAIEALVRPQVESGSLRFRRERLRTLHDVRRLAGAQRGTFNAVLLLAHGSHDGVMLARNTAFDWRSAARALTLARPKFLMAVSCNAGSATVTDILFSELPTLQRVVGSPEKMTTEHAQLARIELLAALWGKGLRREYGTALNVLNVIATNGLLFTRTRQEWESMTPMDRVLVDVAGSVGKLTLREVWRSL